MAHLNVLIMNYYLQFTQVGKVDKGFCVDRGQLIVAKISVT